MCSQGNLSGRNCNREAPFRPQHLSGWNGMKGIFRTAATSPLLITEWWDGLRYLLFPPACIPRCRRAEHLCQYSFSGKSAGRALLSGLIKGSESAGFWTLLAGIFPENQASVALHRSRDSGSRLPGKVGEMNGKWRDVLILERRSRTVGC